MEDHSSPLANLKRQFAFDEIRGLEYFQSISWVDEIDSTNKALIQAVREQTLQFPALLIADRQSSGVGRSNRQWWSPTGCLMFSMAIPIESNHRQRTSSAPCIATQSPLLPLRVGSTIASSIESLVSPKPYVKWPNDVYLADRKVSGVLIDTIPQSDGGQPIAVIGVGINCQVDFSQASQELQASATSMHTWATKSPSESTSTESVLVHFLHQWIASEAKQGDSPNWLHEQWPSQSLLDGQWVEVKHASGTARGVCLGISPAGALRIQNEQLEVVEVLAGTVESFRPLVG